jgi:excisionase family DNA binding protein
VEKLYTIIQVAEMFSVHPNTVRRWIKQGKLKTIKLEVGTERITESELRVFMGVEDNGKN